MLLDYLCCFLHLPSKQHEDVVEWSEEGDWPIEFGDRESTQELLDEVFEQIPEQIDLDEFRAEFG